MSIFKVGDTVKCINELSCWYEPHLNKIIYYDDSYIDGPICESKVSLNTLYIVQDVSVKYLGMIQIENNTNMVGWHFDCSFKLMNYAVIRNNYKFKHRKIIMS